MLINANQVIVRLIFINLSWYVSFTHCKNYEFRLIQSNNFQRQELLQQKCDKYHLDNKLVYKLTEADMEHLLIDKKHKFLYCYVPKVSCPKSISPTVHSMYMKNDPLN